MKLQQYKSHILHSKNVNKTPFFSISGGCTYKRVFNHVPAKLTHYSPVMPYGDIDLDQHWFKWWLVASRITLRSISTSEWIMTLFAMASLIEFVPLLSLCILDPVRELTYYFRWLNARETYPQCTEAASLVSFALSHPFVICHKLNMTLYCASITTVHAFPFRVASMPAVRYDLSGGLPTCL